MIEVRINNDCVTVQDEAGTELHFTAEEWRSFLFGVRAGEFDVPPGVTVIAAQPDRGDAL